MYFIYNNNNKALGPAIYIIWYYYCWSMFIRFGRVLCWLTGLNTTLLIFSDIGQAIYIDGVGHVLYILNWFLTSLSICPILLMKQKIHKSFEHLLNQYFIAKIILSSMLKRLSISTPQTKDRAELVSLQLIRTWIIKPCINIITIMKQ